MCIRDSSTPDRSDAPAHSGAASIPADIVRAFTPTGALRATINLGNPILAHRDGPGAPAGVSVALARPFAQRLGVALELIVLDSAGKAVDTVSQDEMCIRDSSRARPRCTWPFSPARNGSRRRWPCCRRAGP